MVQHPIKRLGLLTVVMSCLFGALVYFKIQERYEEAARTKLKPPSKNEELFMDISKVHDLEKQMDKTVWAEERTAELYGAVFERFWDQFNHATNKLDTLAAFPIEQIVVPDYEGEKNAAGENQIFQPRGKDLVWSPSQWRAFLGECHRDGWEGAQAEFRHRVFEPNRGNSPAQSIYYFRMDLAKTNAAERAIVEGELGVEWQADKTLVNRVYATNITVKLRAGKPGFSLISVEKFKHPERSLLIDPLILYDLDGDGLSEIILAAKNVVYRRALSGEYESGPLCEFPLDDLHSALIADFDGDGLADFLCATPSGIFLYKGAAKGIFPGRPVLVWAANPNLRYAEVMTCADIDGDGDLDVFLGQYKVPYADGRLPTPYFDANDGEPSFLLINDGTGQFVDATEGSGLEGKRHRRIFSGSFARLRDNKAADLFLVSDFAGVDIYQNDGHGHFTDVTEKCVEDPKGFGMGHTIADFNLDGRLDLLMIGMESPTVNRLAHLGLWRSGLGDDAAMTSRMVYGNRLLLGRADGSFQQTTLNQGLAHSGWSWGCASADFNNDGYPDVYIANGHSTKASVRDYESEYWLHDRFVAASTNADLVQAYLSSKVRITRDPDMSYGGYEINRLYLNQGGLGFEEVGFLLGVGLQEDSRGVVADDLDGDGRMDLLVTTYEVWPKAQETLRVFRNVMEQTGNWIGFRFREEGGGHSPVGTTVTLHFDGHTTIREIVTGDSYRCQSANAVHFGLGKSTSVETAEIEWANGEKLVLRNPAVNQYHAVSITKR